jgi:hypothetical protein
VRYRSLSRKSPALLCRFLEIFIQEPLVLKAKGFLRFLTLRGREEQDGGVIVVHHRKVEECGRRESTTPFCIS